MAKSSIHIQRAVEGSVGHNSREHFSYSVVFTDDGEQNECTNSVDEAYKIYRDELQQRTQAYTERTGQKLQKSAVTQLSAILNLEKHHTLKDLEPIKKHLEKTFGTKVYQMAIHRDEGKLISKIDGTELYSGKDFYLNTENKKFYYDKQFTKEIDLKDYEIVKNYHAHIEMMGLDKDGNAIRQKMNKRVLKEMQTFVAKELKMERGKENISYSQDEMKQILALTGNKSDYDSNTLFAKRFNEVAKELGFYKERNKRRDTHIYKDVGAEREGAKREALKELEALKVENEALKEENKELKIDNEALKYSKKELENQIKDLSKNLRETLKELGALRPQYAELEQLNKELKEELKNETLKHENILKSYQDLEKNLKEQLTKKDEKIDNLAAENIDLKSEIEALKYQLDLKEKRSNSYFGLNEELKSEIIALKSQITDLEEQKEDLEEKVIELEEKVDSRANTDYFDFEELQTRITASRERAESPESDSSSLNRIKEVQEESKSSSIERYNDLKAYAKSINLSAKFAEIDKKAELEQSSEAPVKKRNGRERA